MTYSFENDVAIQISFISPRTLRSKFIKSWQRSDVTSPKNEPKFDPDCTLMSIFLTILPSFFGKLIFWMIFFEIFWPFISKLSLTYGRFETITQRQWIFSNGSKNQSWGGLLYSISRVWGLRLVARVRRIYISKTRGPNEDLCSTVR
jgi:hypothetical protein